MLSEQPETGNRKPIIPLKSIIRRTGKPYPGGSARTAAGGLLHDPLHLTRAA